MLGRGEWKALLRFGIRDGDAGEGGKSRPPHPRFDEQLLPRGRLFSHPTGDLQMVRSIGPRALDFALHRGFLIGDHDRVRRQEVEQVAASGSHRARRSALLRFHGENGHAIERVARALRIEIEAANGGDLVAPPFDACRRRHPEPVDVENSATNAVLRDFSDRGTRA